MNMQHPDIESWHLPHMGNAANDSDHDNMVLYNRELSDAANWRLSVESDCDDDMCVGTWEELQLRTADWLTEHPLLTALVVVSGLALAVALSHLMPAPWWSKT
jgi:hypothetical protein